MQVKNGIDVIELIAVMAGAKPAMMVTVEKSFMPSLEAIAGNYGLHCLFEGQEDRSSKGPIIPRNDVRLFMGTDLGELEKLRRDKAKGDNEGVGKSLGYPDCCVQSLLNCIANRNDKESYIREAAERSSSFPLYTNNIFNFSSRLQKRDETQYRELFRKNKNANFIRHLGNMMNMHLISHMPCSYDCKESCRMGRRVLRAVREADGMMAYEIEKTLAHPVLFMGKFRFAVFDGAADRRCITYRSVMPPNSLLERKLLRSIKEGDSIEVENGELRIYRENRHIGGVKEAADILPFGRPGA